MKIDVVYVLGTGSGWGDNELRYSLRSLQEFISDIGQIFVIGSRPAWLTNVVHLPYPDKYVCKERNIMEKLAYCCGHPDLSQQFLHVHDDHFALVPAAAGEIPNWAGGPLSRLAHGINPKNHWRDAVLNTSRELSGRGLTEHNFDLHYPMLFDKDLYPKIMDEYDWKGNPRGFVVKSLYANTLKLTPTFSRDLKVNTRLTMPEIVGRLNGCQWFSIGNGALNSTFKNLMAALYPTPSRYEIQ